MTPRGDGRPDRLPTVTLALIVVNIVVFGVGFVA